MPVSIVDIGSNSVRLIVYDGLRRSPTALFNEKILCGLGRGIAIDGRMNDEGIARALTALTRFRAMSQRIGSTKMFAFATAADREASNGRRFIEDAEAALGHKIKVLTGKREARFAAFGVMAGIPGAAGIVGDLGGGSLELVEIGNGRIGDGVTLPLGSLRLIDLSDGDSDKAQRLVEDAIARVGFLERLRDGHFYAVGGSWRNFARLHMAQTRYPLHVLHQYTIDAGPATAFADLLSGLGPDTLRDIHAINRNRAETLPMAALVLKCLLARSGARDIVMSAFGAREGMLFSKLSSKAKQYDPLLAACRDFARLRARSGDYAGELCRWTDSLFGARPRLRESAAEQRLRHASCYLADIGWRAHPDYRGEQSMTIISQGSFAGIDHPGRVFLALSVFYRYEGAWSENTNHDFNELVDDDTTYRARIIATAQRLAFVLSGAMPGVLAQIELKIGPRNLILHLPKKYADLYGERVYRRLCDLAELIGKNPLITN